MTINALPKNSSATTQVESATSQMPLEILPSPHDITALWSVQYITYYRLQARDIGLPEYEKATHRSNTIPSPRSFMVTIILLLIHLCVCIRALALSILIQNHMISWLERDITVVYVIGQFPVVLGLIARVMHVGRE